MKLKAKAQYIYEIDKFCCEQLKTMWTYGDIEFDEQTGQFILNNKHTGIEYGFIYCPFCGKLIDK